MDESHTPPEIAPVPESPQPDEVIVEPLSVTDKFIGILTEPTPTYENVRDTGPRTTDWLIPLIALVIVILAGTLLRFSNEAFLDKIRQQQIEAMQERVDSGAMTQQQADAAFEQLEKFGGMQKIFASVGVVLGVPIVFFLIALVYWLIAKFLLKANMTYVLMLSVFGLTAYIGVIDQLISIILGYVTGNFFATLSPTLFMEPDMTSKVYKFMNNLNPITIWSYYVFSVGLHIVGKISKAKAFGLVFGLWILWVIISTLLNFSFGGM